MADWEAYFGDPDFVDVSVKGLLSKAFAANRRQAMIPGKAFGKMPDAGDPFSHQDGWMMPSVMVASANPTTSPNKLKLS